MTLRGVIVSFIMTIVLSIMVLGYAALQQRIDIEAEATVDSTYKVQINSVKEKSTTGDARSTSVFQYNGLSTTFHVGLTNSTDTITYEIELNNLGTVDAILNNTEVLIDGSNNMKVVRLGVKNGDILLANSLKVLTITIKLTEVTSSEQTANITINLDYTRLKGGTGEVVPEIYPIYQIGDKITFAGSDWYVIEDSNRNQDYVTVLKENILTSLEIGNSFSYKTKGVARDYMPYYWSDTCHLIATYGTDIYDDSVETGCSGHNDYAGSKLKEMLETTYLPTLNSYNLKEIDSYKIRLITIEELQKNFGLATERTGNVYFFDTNVVPSWIVSNMSYWTMSPNWDIAYVQVVSSDRVVRCVSDRPGYYIRPVINLYKDAID